MRAALYVIEDISEDVWMWDRELGFGTSAFHGTDELHNPPLYLHPAGV